MSVVLRASLDLSARLQAIFRHRGRVIGRGQREVADRMHLHNSILSLWVRGKRPVPGARIPALASALEMTVDALLDGVNLPPEPACAEPELSFPPTPLPERSLSIGQVSSVRLSSGNYRRYCRRCGTVRISHEPIWGECCPVPVQAPALLPARAPAPVRPVVRTFDVFCLLCARGVGRGGVRCFVHQLPHRRHCITCGGVLLAEDLTGGTHLRDQRATVGRRFLDDAALERAAR